MNFFGHSDAFFTVYLSEIGNALLFGAIEMVKSTKRRQKNAWNIPKRRILYRKFFRILQAENGSYIIKTKIQSLNFRLIDVSFDAFLTKINLKEIIMTYATYIFTDDEKIPAKVTVNGYSTPVWRNHFM